MQTVTAKTNDDCRSEWLLLTWPGTDRKAVLLKPGLGVHIGAATAHAGTEAELRAWAASNNIEIGA